LSSLQLGLRVGGHLALTTLAQRNHNKLSYMAGAVDYSAINIVVVVVIVDVVVLVTGLVSW